MAPRPRVNDWLIARTGDGLMPAYYMMGACLVGAIALITVPETTRCPINGRETPGTAKAPPQLDYELHPARV